MKNLVVTHAAGIFPFFSIADGGGILKLIVLFSCFVSTLSHLIVSVVIHNPACQGLWVTALTTESCPHLFGERLNLTGRSEPKKIVVNSKPKVSPVKLFCSPKLKISTANAVGRIAKNLWIFDLRRRCGAFLGSNVYIWTQNAILP